MDDKDFCFFYFFNLINVLYRIEADHWLNPKVLSPDRGLPEGLADEAFTDLFLLMVFAMVINFYDSFNTS